MKAAHSQAKGPNYHGNKVTSCFTAPPSSQEPGKMFQQNFLYSPPPFFFGGGGVELVRRQGACCPRSMFKTRCSPQRQLGKAKKTTGLKTHSFYITISPTAHSWQPSHRAQSLGYRSYSGARRLDHTNLVTLRPQDCLCVSLSGASSTWAQQYQQPNSFLVTLLVQYINVSS